MKKHIHTIQSGVLIVVLLLTLYNTYSLHFGAAETASQAGVEQDMSAFAESINTNAGEIQTLKANMETMVNFINENTAE